FALAFVLLFVVATLLDRLIIGSRLVELLLADTGLTYTFFNQIPILRNAFVLLSIMGLASLIRFFKLYLQQTQEKHQLQEEYLQTQLTFLKAQLNPHFLFNALNNLYSQAVQNDQANIAKGLEQLSGIMHYLTYESAVPKVALEKEIKLIQNYIEVEQSRLAPADEVTISFKVKGSINGQHIAPVLLLPLVENAFKHGVRPEQKSLVHIELSIDGQELEFQTRNTDFAKTYPETPPTKNEKLSTVPQHTGIGFRNTQHRLQLIYPGRHRFETQRSNNYFLASLKVTL
ncbi:MAG: histidine kinase, partial [Bacteroidota bacterium]